MSSLYSSERVLVGYNGISDTVVPMAFSTVETMVAATSGDKPLVQYIATSPEQSEETEVLNGLFSYYWDLDGWSPKTVQYSRGLFKLGTSVMMLYWDIDHPKLINIPLRDFFIDPTASIFNYQNAGYMGYRFLANIEDLKKEMIVDPDKKELVPKYKNLDKLSDFQPGDPTDKQEKDTHMGTTLDKEAQKGQIEVICYWTKDEVIYVANKEAVIYYSENHFKDRQKSLGWENPTGMYPFIVDANYPDESLLYGKSVLEPILKPIELLNDLTNQNVDAVSWALDPVMELDPQYASYIDKIKNVTGAVYPFKPGSYSAVQKPTIPSNAFSERTNIKNEIRETTAVDEIIKGVSAPSRTTATEIKAQVASAGRRFDLIISQMENGGYYQLAKVVFQMVRMYVTTPTMYRVIGKDGVDWKKFDPKMFQGEYEPRIKLKATLDNEKNKKMRDLKEMYTAFLGSPFVDQQALTRITLEKAFDLEPDEVDPLMTRPQQAAQGDQKTQGKPQQTPEDIALTGVAKAYGKGIAPDIAAQLEGLAGLHPSVTHGGAIDNVASQQAVDAAGHGNALADAAMPPPNAMPGQAPQGAQPSSAPTPPAPPQQGVPVGG